MIETLHQDTSAALEEQLEALTHAIVNRQYEMQPDLMPRYGEEGRKRTVEDVRYHLQYLSETIRVDSVRLFSDYMAWAKIVLVRLGVPVEDLIVNLDIIQGVLEQHLTPEQASVAAEYLEAARERLRAPLEVPEPFVQQEALPYGEMAHQYLTALLNGDRRTASSLILKAVEQGASIKDLYLYVFRVSQYEIGRLWQMNKISVAQEHFCTAATQMIMSQLYSHLFVARRGHGTIIGTSISGELHEIGIRMVMDFFELEGWDTFYLGANTPIPSILRTLRERNADVLAVSATMTFHLSRVAQVIKAVQAAEDLQHVKILVGGLPFNVETDLWQRIGADGSATNPDEAVALANSWVKKAETE